MLMIDCLFLSSKIMIGCFEIQFIAEPGIGHQVTRFMMKELADWFDRFLNP